MFNIGEKVVCIAEFKNIDQEEYALGVKGPIKGEIYTIRRVFDEESIIFLQFEELINPILGYDGGKDVDEVRWNSAKFRKLDHQFGEDVLAEITKQVKEEELVLILKQ